MLVKKYAIRNSQGSYYVTGLGHWVFSNNINQAMPYYLSEEAEKRRTTIVKYLPKEMLPLEIVKVQVELRLVK